MCGGGSPLDVITDPLEGIYNGAKDAVDKGLKEINNGVTDSGRWVGDSLDKAGREVGRGVGEVTGANAYERGMEALSKSQERQARQLLWERENAEAKNNEADLQAEARKRLKASQGGGRAGTILTGGEASTSALGASSGTNILGA